jgi:hypothetical protein
MNVSSQNGSPFSAPLAPGVSVVSLSFHVWLCAKVELSPMVEVAVVPTPVWVPWSHCVEELSVAPTPTFGSGPLEDDPPLDPSLPLLVSEPCREPPSGEGIVAPLLSNPFVVLLLSEFWRLMLSPKVAVVWYCA